LARGFLSTDGTPTGSMRNAAMVQQIAKNRPVLLKLAESHRTLELLQDPERPHRKLLVMKDASGWQSTRNHGVIEFKD